MKFLLTTHLSYFPGLLETALPFVAMVNPAAGKGLAIVLALAEHLPKIPFACVPT